MSNILPQETIDVLRSFNDMIIEQVGIPCTLYVPNNLTALESQDLYTKPDDITFDKYEEQTVWVEWFAKDIVKLRKEGLFTEDELPITGLFANDPEVTIQSYIEVPIQYILGDYKTDKFEVVSEILSGTYAHEIYRRFKLAPLRKKV
jgi:hypothetical protein